MMRIAFAGTPEFAAVALRALIETEHTIALVLTQPDRPAGRGLRMQASPVKQLALTHHIPVIQPASLRLDNKNLDYAQQAKQAHETLRTSGCDVMVVAAYGLILPYSILTLPKYGCVNIHASLLPRWRGAAPIHRAIEAGDAETGITIMQMDEGLDTGAMLMRENVPILSRDTTGSLHDTLAMMGGRLIVSSLGQLERGTLAATPQLEVGTCYAAKITKEEAGLDFTQDAATLVRKIHAFNPFPGATVMLNGTPIKIWDAEVVPSTHACGGVPGQVLSMQPQEEVWVQCGQGVIRLLELQKSGGKRLSVGEFLKGFAVVGGRFE